MYIRKCFFLAFAVILFSWWGASQVEAAVSTPVRIEVLERADCVHCQEERAYLDALVQKRSDITVTYIDISTSQGAALFDAVVEKAKLTRSTPITIVGATPFQGFDTAETTGPRIEYWIDHSKDTLDQGFEAFVARGSASMVAQSEGSACDASGETICRPTREPLLVRIPGMGTVDIAAWSLPTLTVVLGFLDGFNPCAMWVLVTFLIVLSQMGSRRRMAKVVGLFLVAEAVMYYLILNVWFHVWDFIGMDRIITPIIGVVSIGGGLFFLYEWYKSLGTEMACRVINMEERSKLVQKIKRLSSGNLTIVTAIGIVMLALSVNIIEFACSIGYPQTFTKIIQMNGLDFWHTQGLMAIYIFFYMLDDFVVFGLALWGFEKLHLTDSFSRWSALIGGAVMLVLGWMLIFHPEILRSLS